MALITPSADGTTAVIAVDRIPSHTYVGEPWMILSNSEITHNNNHGNNNNGIRGGTSIYSGNNVILQNINYYGGNVAVNDGGANVTGNMTFINYYQGAPPAVASPDDPPAPVSRRIGARRVMKAFRWKTAARPLVSTATSPAARMTRWTSAAIRRG